jgi:hypothetical protein
MVQLEAELHELEGKFDILKDSVNKDLAHLQATYRSDFNHLSEKIEILRDEIRQQTGGILELLTKIIGKD